MNLPRFGVTKPVPVNLLTVAVIVAGVYSAFTLRREFFPETTPDSATITLPYPGATPQEIEESMARKVEDALAELDEVERIETTISEGGGGILVEFRDGVDVDDAVDEVERALDLLDDLPEEAEEIRVAEFEPVLPVIMLTLYGDADEEVLKQSIRQIEDDLRSLPNMGDIEPSGVRDYEIRVEVDETALQEHGLSLPQVADAIRAWMIDLPGGTVRTNVGNINVRTMGVAERAETIRGIPVIALPEGQSLRVRDIATVREGFVDVQIERRFNGQPGVSLTVFKTSDQDAVEIAEMVRAYVAGRNGQPFEARFLDRLLTTSRERAWALGASSPYPLPGSLETHSDLARFIEGRLDLLIRNARAGAVLVFLTLLLFLSWRAACWVGVGLVIAICGTLVLMSWADITLNLLTMFGLIIVLGMLVDDAIVVAENIQARHDRGEPSLSAAIHGAGEVFWPVVATVTTTIVAFIPLTFVRGRMGDLLGMLPWVVACALFVSLVESVYMLPSHFGHSLAKRDRQRAARAPGPLRRFERWRDRIIMERIVPTYARFVRVSLEYRYVSTAAALAILIVSIGMVAGGRAEFTFLPTSDSETIIIDVRLPIGAPIEQTADVMARIDRAAADQPETLSVSTLIGIRASVDDTSGVQAAGQASHLGQAFVELVPIEQRDRDSQQIIAAIREAIGSVDEAESIKFSEIGAGPSGADITLHVTGPEIDAIVPAVEEIQALLAEFAGVFDITDDNYDAQRELQIELLPGAAAAGFSVADVARQVRAALFGIDAHVFSERREDIDVRVRLEERARRALETIDSMWVFNPQGNSAPLSELATLSDRTGYATISRINRERAVTVTADVAPDTNPEEVMRDAQPRLQEILARHPGVGIEFGGRQRDMITAMSSLPAGALAAIIMIYVILAWLFSSYTQPLAVMLAIPFGAIGVIWGHMLLGFELTFLSLIGAVALSGIVVNDSLIFVQFVNDKLAEGLPLREALVEAGRQRLRPIFLTTITTVLGLTPLMLEQSFQARFLIPMAIAIAFGLMSATVLILFVLPCMLIIIDDIKAASHWLWHGQSRAERAAAEAAGASASGVGHEV